MYVVGYYHRKGLKVAFNEATDPEKRQKATAEMRFPGDAVPECEGWKKQVLQAHLNLGWIQHQAQYQVMKDTHEAPKKKAEWPQKPAEAAPVPPPTGLAGKSKTELARIATERGLSADGTKKELIARLEGLSGAA